MLALLLRHIALRPEQVRILACHGEHRELAAAHGARMLAEAHPYLGDMLGEFSDWTPLTDRAVLYPEDLDTADPWQFKNVRVT